MTAATIALVVLWVGVTFYALFAGADFGGGFWDLFAGRTRSGMPQRRLIEHSLAPVWEANHVWLIFVLVMLWTCWPPVFAAIMSTLFIPLTLVALGIIARGAAFAFRKDTGTLWVRRLFGATFALSSVLTPFFLGAVAGAIASARVPPGLAAGHPVTSWVNPTSFLGGVLAVGSCAYLAAAYLCDDAMRAGRPDLAREFSRRAFGTGVVVGVVALCGIGVLRFDSPRLFDGLTGRALPLVIVSALAGVAALALLRLRRFVLVRAASALAVTAILWGWAVAQYPLMLPPGTDFRSTVAYPAVLAAVLWSLLGALVVLAPSMLWLYASQRRDVADETER
jgi:cytochrome d ubiquinol oxidase subunit II